MNIDDAKIKLPDGTIAYDCVKLAQVPTEGVFIKDCVGKVLLVRTMNPIYQLKVEEDRVLGRAFKDDGSEPRYLSFELPVNVLGSTWGGSMIKMGYVGVGMYLEMSWMGHHGVRTSQVQSIQLAELRKAA